MRRREVVIGTAATLAHPFAGRAQQPPRPVIGYLSSTNEGADAGVVAGTREGLAAGGFADGGNATIVFRYGDGDYDRLPGLAEQLTARNVNVIVTSGLPATLAAKAATTAIPIVFRLAIDPVAFDLVESLKRPGRNLTGVTTLFDSLTPKRLDLLHQLVPAAGTISFLVNPDNPNAGSHREKAMEAARTLGFRLSILPVRNAAEIEPAFATARQLGFGAVLLGDDPFFAAQRESITTAAARQGLPTMYYVRDFATAGGLVSYGPSLSEMARQSGGYAAQILKGAKPSDLPVLQPTKFELVINLKTARALGITVPQLLLAQADEIIE